jgi:hypothetical protein
MFYYITAQSKDQKGLIAGPYQSEAAIERSGAMTIIRDKAASVNPAAHFWDYAIESSRKTLTTTFGVI